MPKDGAKAQSPILRPAIPTGRHGCFRTIKAVRPDIVNLPLTITRSTFPSTPLQASIDTRLCHQRSSRHWGRSARTSRFSLTRPRSAIRSRLMTKGRCALGITKKILRHLAIDDVDRFFISGVRTWPLREPRVSSDQQQRCVSRLFNDALPCQPATRASRAVLRTPASLIGKTCAIPNTISMTTKPQMIGWPPWASAFSCQIVNRMRATTS